MLYGVELAKAIAAQLEGVVVLQIPPWPSRTPTAPAALATVRGQAWHVLAVVDTWSMLVAPPPALAGRFARRCEWSRERPSDAAKLAERLRAFAASWWEERPDDVGAMDVAGAITHALAALGDARGAFGNIVYANPGRAEGAEHATACGIGRADVDAGPRSPGLVQVLTEREAISVTLTDATGQCATTQLRTVGELAAALPGFVTTVRAADDASASFRARVKRLGPVAVDVTARLGGDWQIHPPFEVRLNEPPMLVCDDGERIFRLVARERALVEVGGAQFAPDGPELAAALAKDAQIVRVGRLKEGRKYRVTRPLQGVPVGAIVVFREVHEEKPRGDDVWVFDIEGGGAFSLSSHDDGVLVDALADHLVRVD